MHYKNKRISRRYALLLVLCMGIALLSPFSVQRVYAEGLTLTLMEVGEIEHANLGRLVNQINQRIFDETDIHSADDEDMPWEYLKLEESDYSADYSDEIEPDANSDGTESTPTEATPKPTKTPKPTATPKVELSSKTLKLTVGATKTVTIKNIATWGYTAEFLPLNGKGSKPSVMTFSKAGEGKYSVTGKAVGTRNVDIELRKGKKLKKTLKLTIKVSKAKSTTKTVSLVRPVDSVPVNGKAAVMRLYAEDSRNVYDLTIDTSTYETQSQKNKEKILGIALSEVQQSQVSKINRNRIYHFINDSDSTTAGLVRQLSDEVRADYYNAFAHFAPFSGVIGFILGFLTLLIFAFLGLTIVIDLAFITIPGFQLFCIQMGDKSKEGGKRAKFASLEAMHAVEEAESGKDFKEPLGAYFRLKTKQFIVMGICLLYLVSGQIYNLIADILDMFSGLWS